MTSKEIIEEQQIKLREMLINLKNPEEIIQSLIDMGLDSDSATRLISAYRKFEDARETARRFWGNDKTKISEIHEDYGDIIGNNEIETRDEFDKLIKMCALLTIINKIEPIQISDEIMDELYELNIGESKITNPAVAKIFEYYTRWKESEEQRKKELGSIKQAASEYVESEEQEKNDYRRKIELLEKENANLSEKLKKIQMYIKNLPTRLNMIMSHDEQKYQMALKRIKTLEKQVEELNGRGIFQIIGAKLRGKPKNKTELLPDASETMPGTLSDGWSKIIKQLGLEIKDESIPKKTDEKGMQQTSKRDSAESQK